MELVREPRNLLGVLFMSGGFFMYSAVDATSKLLTDTLHPFQIVWTRQWGFLAFVIVMILIKGPGLLKSARPGLQFLRGFLAVGSATCFTFAIIYVPLADAVAVSFVAPFFVTLMGVFWLGERVGARRVIAIIIGFLGAMIIIRPGLGVVHPASGFVVLAALLFALRQILSRILGSVDSTMTTIAWSTIVASLIIAIPLPFVWIWPTGSGVWTAIAIVAVLAGVAEFLIIRALELAETVAVAPVHYTLLIWGTFWGYVIFNDIPDIWTWTGALIVMASGIYTMYRERKTMRG